jgi:hypothetical protein
MSGYVASKRLMCNRVHCNVMSRFYKFDEITHLDIAPVIISTF